MPPMVQPDTPRLKFQFPHLARNFRHDALQLIFDDLQARSLSDRKAIIRRIEQIVWLYGQYPKTRYNTTPSAKDRATWVRAVNRLSTELAELLRECPYGENYLAECHRLSGITDDLDTLAKGHNAKAGKKAKPGGRPREGFDWLVANLAILYTERTGLPAGYSRNDHSEAIGPLVRVVKAVCDLIDLKAKTPEAIGKTINRLSDKT